MQPATVQITRHGEPPVPHSPVDFAEKLSASGVQLVAGAIDTLQVNVGRVCNQACKHCHVDASPKRTESMQRETVDACLEALRRFSIPALDITGGAPELNPNFRYFVAEARRLGTRVMVRHNLTVMFEEGQTDLAGFFAAHEVEVISSLPYFLPQQTDAQRGTGVFEKSVTALTKLNDAGYGRDEKLILSLVYNPVGAYLPPPQAGIEADFRRELDRRYGIRFDHLYTITNMPIARFLDWLRRSKNEEAYMTKLVNAFNPATLTGLMCRNLINVDWRGRLFDCDFNQMLELGLDRAAPQTIFEFSPAKLRQRKISTAAHCFGCTAGAGSSCGGAVAS